MASGADSSLSAFSLLRRYLQVYWLKPFDAINDTANACALRHCLWEDPVLEIGGGDGVFSFTMHGGEFCFSDDRYQQSDPNQAGDIYDIYCNDSSLHRKREARRVYACGLDLKLSHLLKARETGMYRLLIQAPPVPLPFKSQSFKTVFLYVPHGLRERDDSLHYDVTLSEVRRVLQRGGRLLMTAYARGIGRHFICYHLARAFARRGWSGAAIYLDRLDAGRHEEISDLSRTLGEWYKLFESVGFRPEQAWAHISPLAWRLYDTQTRPLIRSLIRSSQRLSRLGLKGVVKAAWIVTMMPMLIAFYHACAAPAAIRVDSHRDTHRLLFVFQLRSTQGGA